MTRLKWFIIGFLSVFAISLSIIWFQRATVESDLLKGLIKKVSASLPFTIENYKLSKNLDSLSLTLNVQGEQVHLDGPLHWTWIKKDGIRLEYAPKVEIEGASPFSLLLTAQTQRQWTRLEKFSFQIPSTDFQWKKRGIDGKKFSFSGSFEDQILKSELSLSSLAWADPKDSNHAMNLTDFHGNIEMNDPAKLNSLRSEFSAKEAEMLWGKIYLDLPLSHFPLAIILDVQTIHLNIGKNKLKADAILDAPLQSFNSAKIDFKIAPIPLSDFIPWTSKNLSSFAPTLQTLGDYQFKKGMLSLDGSGEVQKSSQKFVLKKLNAKGNEISFRSANKKLSAEGLNFDLHYHHSDQKHLAHIDAKKINFEHFSGKLSSTEILWNESSFETSGVLPLSLNGIPLSVGKVVAKLKPEFDLESSLTLKSVNFTPFANGFCMSSKKIPPLTLSANLTNIQISKSIIDPTGKVEANLFGGKIELNDLGIFDLDTEVPETDFDLDWSGIDLAKLNEWLNFGEVKGTFEGYAHEVVLQDLLPTQYHFMLSVDPYDKSSKTARVEFSPEAMKNVVKIFTGADLDQQIPGIAGWLMFGWPSHVLGGYDVYYAGLKLNSEDGHIVVETLDPPGIVQSERKHFVLYGPRFKMPLNNSTYPLVIDATAMSNFVHQLFTQLLAIKEKKEKTPHEEDKDVACETPEI